jgi:NAD(P)-dependent dehydrogenase (short-subunit alcohol dehydrogenase family)
LRSTVAACITGKLALAGPAALKPMAFTPTDRLISGRHGKPGLGGGLMSVLDKFRLDGKVALITGGARGLGKAMALAMAEAGAAVAVTARSLDAAQAASDEIAAATGARTIGIVVEVTDRVAVEAMIATTVDKLGGLHVLVNNAGVNRRGPIEELSEEDFDSVIAANLKGPWLCCRAAAPILKTQKWGRVINLSSIMGEVSMPHRTPYASSKGGLTLMTKTLALEWAPFGINVNALCPGPFATEMNKLLIEDPQVRANFTSKVPLARWADPAELGPAAVFLASEASSFMTGACLFIDGGYTAQ